MVKLNHKEKTYFKWTKKHRYAEGQEEDYVQGKKLIKPAKKKMNKCWYDKLMTTWQVSGMPVL